MMVPIPTEGSNDSPTKQSLILRLERSGATFIVEPLNPSSHCREEFDCGVAALNDYLRLRARKEMDGGTSACFVMVPADDARRIVGYYTLSAATIIRTALPEAMLKKLPRYPELPATLLGRLARDKSFRGQRIGDRLMVSALGRALAASKEVASLAVITDPKDIKAAEFYASFGFQPLTNDRMFLPMRQVESMLNAR
jgi:predicted GNAT family N-acyltransferase